MEAKLRSTGKQGKAERQAGRPKDTEERIENGIATNENNNEHIQ